MYLNITLEHMQQVSFKGTKSSLEDWKQRPAAVMLAFFSNPRRKREGKVRDNLFG